MLYGVEKVTMTGRMEKKMEAAELKMMRWALGVMLKDSEEQVHLGDGKDQENRGEAERRETKMVWAFEEKGRKLLRQKSDGI